MGRGAIVYLEHMGNIGFEEMLVIAVVAIIVFGDNLPQMARKAARFYSQIKNYMSQVRDEVIRNIPDEKTILPEVKDVAPPQMMPIYMDPSDPDYKKPEEPPPPATETKPPELPSNPQ